MSESQNPPPGPSENAPPPPPGGGSPSQGAPPPPPGGGAPPPPSGGGPSTPPPSGGGGGGSVGPPPLQGPPNTVMLILSYLGLLALIPLLVEKDDPYVQWHAKHGLVFLVASVAVSILYSIASTVLSFIDLGCFGCIGSMILGVVLLAVHVVAMIQAIQGKALIIPGLSEQVSRF